LSDDDKTRMAAALAEFGDLGGIVFNRRSGLLVGGHQRTDVLKESVLEVQDLPEQEQDGTVARGYLNHGGNRYSVRVVDWPDDKASAAMLAANRFGRVGQDDAAVLKDVLQELVDAGAIDMELTGYTAQEIEQMMEAASPGEVLNLDEQEQKQATLVKCPKCGFEHEITL